MKLNVSAGLWCLDDFSDRYVPGGYFSKMELNEKLNVFSKIKGLDGIGVVYPTSPLPSDPDKLIKKLIIFNLKVGYIFLDNYSNIKWKYGAL